MGLDIRLPLGLIFLIIGAILAVYGVFTHGSAIYASSMNINLNLIWGGIMIFFGAIMCVAARRKKV